MTSAGTFSSFEVATATAFATVAEVVVFLMLATRPNTAHIEAREEVVKKEVPIAVQPILDLPMLKKGGKRLKAKLPDMWVKKPPIKRFEAKSAPSPMAEDKPLEEPIDTPLLKPDEKPPPPDAAIAKKVDEQVEELPDEKVEEANVDQEGAADGVEEGTETDPLKAFAVSPYKVKISSWFNVRFKRPTDEIPCEELKKLRASVAASVGGDRTVTSYGITKPSGNAIFDQRVEATMAAIVSQHSELPPPPPNYPDILGTSINVAFFVPKCD
jgi:hypothetical protein